MYGGGLRCGVERALGGGRFMMRQIHFQVMVRSAGQGSGLDIDWKTSRQRMVSLIFTNVSARQDKRAVTVSPRRAARRFAHWHISFRRARIG